MNASSGAFRNSPCPFRFKTLVAALAGATTLVLPTIAAPLRAGLARIDISPELPVTLAGYESRKDLSRGVHDPLSARAVAFESRGQRLVLISTDNLGFYSGTTEPIRQAILDACGLKPSDLFLCAIHTHSAPSLALDPAKAHANNVQYTKSLQGKLVEVARTALERLAPVQIGVGLGASPVGVNRREIVRDRSGNTNIVLGRNTEALIDREVQVLKFAPAGQNSLPGALFAFATHSTSLGPKNYLVSGDIHGLAEQFLEHYFGPDFIAPGFAGASGNIDPWVRVLPEFRTNHGWVPEPVLMGTMLGEEVARVVEAIQVSTNDAKILTRIETLPLPARGAQDAGAAATSPFNVTVACIGEVAFVGWGGEVFNELGRTVKMDSPFKTTFVFTHCNGTAGYVPIRSSYGEGGYEVRSSSFAPGAGELLARETVRLLRALKETAGSSAGG